MVITNSILSFFFNRFFIFLKYVDVINFALYILYTLQIALNHESSNQIFFSKENKDGKIKISKDWKRRIKMDELISVQLQLNGNFDDLKSSQIEALFESLQKENKEKKKDVDVNLLQKILRDKPNQCNSTQRLPFWSIKKLKTDFWSPLMTVNQTKRMGEIQAQKNIPKLNDQLIVISR